MAEAARRAARASDGVETRVAAPRPGPGVTATRRRARHPAGGRRARRRARAGASRCGAAAGHRRAHRRGHGRRRRRVQRPAARRARRAAARRPADGAGGAVRRRRVGPHLEPRWSSTGSPARATAPATRRQPADRRALGAARRPGRGPRLGRPACSAPRPGAADGDGPARDRGRGRVDADARPGVHVGARPGRGRHRAQVGSSARRLDPAGAAGVPEAVAAVSDADWVVLGPGSWFTSVHAAPAGARAARGAGHARRARRSSILNLAPQPGETAGFSPETTSRCSPRTPRTCGSTSCSPIRRPSRDRRRRSSAPCASLGRRAGARPTSRWATGTPRHDPGSCSAASVRRRLDRAVAGSRPWR